MKTGVGSLYVIAAPSGTGKTTLVKALVDALPRLTISISHTTRPKRPNEVDGTDYYFVSKETFEDKIAKGDFLEYATVFGELYGTSKSWVEKTLNEGIDVLLEIDWQGQRQITALFPDCITIFILPPSLDTLRDRLLTRSHGNTSQDNHALVTARLRDVKEAISHVHEFGYVVMNDDFVSALHDLKTLIEAGHLLERRQTARHADLIDELMQVEP